MSAARLSTLRLLALVGPSLAIGLMAAPVSTILPAFYATQTGLSLAAIGSVLLVTRIIDALADQVIGYFSDITRSPLGPRKPWLLAGAAVSAFASYFLFNPSVELTAPMLFLWLSLYYLGWSMINVSHSAWISEITGDYHERGRLFGYIGFAGPLGVILIFATPLLPIFATSDVNPTSIAFMGWLIITIAPLTAVLAALFVPEGTSIATAESTFVGLLRSLRSNHLFWWCVAFSLLAAINLGVVSTLVLFYLSNYLQIGDKLAQVLLPNIIVIMVSVPIWMKAIQRWGKHQALAASTFYSMCLYPLLLLIQPGELAFPLFLGWMILLGLGGAALAIIPRAILADIIDYDIWKTGVNRAGNYYAFMTMTEKAVGSVGGALALFLLAVMGFDPKAPALDERARFALLFTIGVVPTLVSLVVVGLVWSFPLNAKRHNIIRRRLERRANSKPS